MIRILFAEPFEGDIKVDFFEPWYWRISESISLLFFVCLILESKKLRKLRL